MKLSVTTLLVALLFVAGSCVLASKTTPSHKTNNVDNENDISHRIITAAAIKHKKHGAAFAPFTESVNKLRRKIEASSDSRTGAPLSDFDNSVIEAARKEFLQKNAHTGGATIPVTAPRSEEEIREEQQQLQQHRLANTETTSDPFADAIAKYLNLPECVSGAALLNSANLFTFWMGGAFGDFGGYYGCRSTPGLKYCNLEMKLMCAKVNANATNISDIVQFHEYPTKLECNGPYGSYQSGICYNSTVGGCNATGNFSDALLRWSLDYRNVIQSRLLLYPLCYALEKSLHFAGEPEQIPDCHPNVSFFYVRPWCDMDNPLGENYQDDAAMTTVKVFLLGAICFAGFATVVGFCKRAVETMRIDFCDGAGIRDDEAKNEAAASRVGLEYSRHQDGGDNHHDDHQQQTSPGLMRQRRTFQDETQQQAGSQVELQERLLENNSNSKNNEEQQNGNGNGANNDDKAATSQAVKSAESVSPREAADTTTNATTNSSNTNHNHDADDNDDGMDAPRGRMTTGASMAMFSSSVNVEAALHDNDGPTRGKNSKSKREDAGDADDEQKGFFHGVIVPHLAGFFDTFDLISGVLDFLKPTDRQMPTGFFDGVRSIAMTLILAGHSIYVPLQDGGSYSNYNDIFNAIKTYGQSIPLLPALVCVDCFFFISGFLSQHLLTVQLERICGPARPEQAQATTAVTQRKPPAKQRPVQAAVPMLIMAYINRYLRLTPTMVTVIAVSAYIFPTLVYGPRSEILLRSNELVGCKDNLWKAALYVQNLQDPDEYQCVSWTWFLMVDMQIFLFVPVFALLLYCFKRFTKLTEWIPVVFVTGLTIFFYAWGIHHHPVTTQFTQDDGKKVHTYFRAADRATPYVFGILTAMLGAMPPVITWLKDKRVFYALQFFAFALGLTIWNVVWKMISKYYVDQDLVASLNYGGHAAFFLVGLFWMLITLCALAGWRTWFTRFLEAKFFTVFAKLSFGLYLWHTVVMILSLALDWQFRSFQVFNLWMAIGGTFCMTCVFSLGTFLIIDRPVGRFCGWLGSVTGAKKKTTHSASKAVVKAPTTETTTAASSSAADRGNIQQGLLEQS